MRVRSGVWFGVLAVMLGASTAAAQDLKVGQTVAGKLVLNAKQVPLPEGEWKVAAIGYNRIVTGGDVGAFGTIDNMFLVRGKGEAVDAVAEINANTVPTMDGWGTTKDCTAEDSLFKTVVFKSGWDGSCFFGRRTEPGPDRKGPLAWSKVTQFATTNKLALPAAFVTVGFRTSDRRDVVDVRFHFNPETRNQPTAADAWTAKAIEENPARKTWVQELNLWAANYGGYVERGLRNQLNGRHVMPMPSAAAVAAPRPELEELLGKLDQLRVMKLITEEQHAQQKAIIEKQLAPPTTSESGSLDRTIQKAISFRVFGSAVDWILAYAVTFSSAVSTGITASIIVLHTIAHILLDQNWEKYWRGTVRDGTRIVEFANLGAK
ncbi:MAG TPA: hypothetical protein VGE72_11945 [Azospirillum sp.]